MGFQDVVSLTVFEFLTLVVIYGAMAVAFGFVEAYSYKYYFGNNRPRPTSFSKPFAINEHVFFNLIRGVSYYAVTLTFLTFFGVFVGVYALLKSTIGLCLMSVLIFPFFHDGAFYYFTNRLYESRIYKKGFFDQSKSTTAMISLGFKARVVLVLVYFLFYSYIFLFK